MLLIGLMELALRCSAGPVGFSTGHTMMTVQNLLKQLPLPLCSAKIVILSN